MKQLKIHNIRMGHATNSSSLHSLLMWKKSELPRDTAYEGEYGWDYWTAASRENKHIYLSILLWNSLKETVSPLLADAVMKEMTGGLGMPDEDYYVDHQSVYVIPYEFGKEYPDVEFYKDLQDFILQDDLIILGGNDNDSTVHELIENTYSIHEGQSDMIAELPVLERFMTTVGMDDAVMDQMTTIEVNPTNQSFILPIPRDTYAAAFICRKDPIHNAWTIYEKDNGAKIRFSFDDQAKEITKLYAPELADLNITDYCAENCQYCYMNSTVHGKHGNHDHIREIISALAELKVFEIAVAGEPLAHPRFMDILEFAREKGITPNFTTRNLEWLRNPKKWPRIIQTIGAFAFSIENADQMDEVVNLIRVNGIANSKVNFHIMLGTLKENEYVRILKKAHELKQRITLLGYKTTGRGSGFKMIPYDWWLRHITDMHQKDQYLRVGVDTVIAAEYQEQIEQSGVHKAFFHTEEGKFSAYINTVDPFIAPSSFMENDEQKVALIMDDYKNPLADQIVKAFAQF